MEGKEICLLNDSFPPIIDGVANVVKNYARVLKKDGYCVSIVTPENPDADDSIFDYPVIRYPAIDLRKEIGYTAGNPFSKPVQKKICKRDIGLLHCHCPATSNILARQIRGIMDIPLVMTYHTKYDIDIANIVKNEPIQDGVIRLLVESVSSCDELWTVSDGAGRNIQKLGYKGDYIVMPNGVDIPIGTASDSELEKYTSHYDLPHCLPVFLFVGRMMWYKGIRIILEALAALKSQKLDFRMVFIGNGSDFDEIKAFSNDLNLDDKVIFLGAILDRKELTAWYSRANLMLFPSTFDTNGLVVREAAACSLGSVLVKDSCAAEGVTDRRNGLLIDENAASLAVCLAMIMQNPERMREIGRCACSELYLSWDEAIKMAEDRYEIVMDNYKSGKYTVHKNLADDFFRAEGSLLEFLDTFGGMKKSFEDTMKSEVWSHNK